MKKVISTVMAIAVCSSFAVSNLADIGVDSLKVSAVSSVENCKQQYKNILTNLSENPNKTSINYTLFDMNYDDMPELIVISGTCEADSVLTFYSIINGSATIVGDNFQGWHAGFYIDTDTNQFCTQWGQMGMGGIIWYTFDGQTVTIEKSQENIDYATGPESNDSFDNYGNFKSCSEGDLYYSTFDGTWTTWNYLSNGEKTEYSGKNYDIIDNYDYKTEDEPEPFTQEQLNSIRKSLGVPDDLDVTITQDTPSYWETGEVWITPVSVYYENTLIASVHANSFTMEHVKEIMMFSEEQNSNKCGDNAYWDFDETTGTLTISGTGAVTSGGWWTSDEPVFINPDTGESNLKHIIIEEGITELHKYDDNKYNDNIYNGVEFGASVLSISLPNTLTYIDDWVFSSSADASIGFSLKEITIPASVMYIGEHAFNSVLAGDGGIIEFYDNFTIKGYTGSTAQKYANDNHIKFVALDADDFEEIPTVDEMLYKEYYINKHTNYDSDLVYSHYSHAPEDNPFYKTSKVLEYDLKHGAMHTALTFDVADTFLNYDFGKLNQGFHGNYFDDTYFYNLFLANMLAESFREEELASSMREKILSDIAKYEKQYGDGSFNKALEEVKKDKEKYDIASGAFDRIDFTNNMIDELENVSTCDALGDIGSVVGTIFMIEGWNYDKELSDAELKVKKEEMYYYEVFYQAMLKASENTKTIFRSMYNNTNDKLLKTALEGYIAALDGRNVKNVILKQYKEIKKDAENAFTFKVSCETVIALVGIYCPGISFGFTTAKLVISIEKTIYDKLIESDKLLLDLAMFLAADHIHQAMYQTYKDTKTALMATQTFENAKLFHDTYNMYKTIDIIAIPYMKDYLSLFVSENLKYDGIMGVVQIVAKSTELNKVFDCKTNEIYPEIIKLSNDMDNLKKEYCNNSCCMNKESYIYYMNLGNQIFNEMTGKVVNYATDKINSISDWMNRTFDIHFISCPVYVNVFDESGNIIATLSDTGVETSAEFQKYFYTIPENESDTRTKVVVLPHDNEDYHYEIIGTDNGTMNIVSYYVDNISDSNWFDSNKVNYSFDNIAVTNSSNFTVEKENEEYSLINLSENNSDIIKENNVSNNSYSDSNNSKISLKQNIASDSKSSSPNTGDNIPRVVASLAVAVTAIAFFKKRHKKS